MVFLVRAMRSDPRLVQFKVVVVTNRLDLQDQLGSTAVLTGESVLTARSVAEAKALLSEPGKALVFAMIQKYRNPKARKAGDATLKSLGVLDPSEDVVVLVDEAHRSQGAALHASLLAALPNCARIGFTGTPIIMGYVVGYFGVAENLKAALAAYAAADIEGALTSVADQVPLLAERRQRVRNLFAARGITRFHTAQAQEACVTALADERLRAAFEAVLALFTESLEIVLPRPQALPHLPDARAFGVIALTALHRYRDGIGFDASLYGGKVRQLIDDHVGALGIEQKIPPVSITAADFDVKAAALPSARARASEMEHAIRYHLREHYDEDPAHYELLSQRLAGILEELGEQWVSPCRRSAGIAVDRDGGLLLHAPAGADAAALLAWARSKTGWVLRKLASKDLLLSAAAGKDFVTGEGFDYLGRHYRLLLTAGPPGSGVKLERGRLHLPRASADAGDGPAAMIGWYRQRGQAWLPPRVASWAGRMGVRPGGLEVRSLGYRWGSLGRGERLNIHWATLQLPVPLVDYVIVHELAHIGQPRHDAAFWAAVQRAMPGHDHRRARLATAGAALWLG